MTRAPRSTRAALADAEDVQSDIIEALSAAGDVEAAAGLLRCQQARAARRPGANGWPWRCRSSAGCCFCRRSSMRRWWYGLREWITDFSEQVTVAALPVRGGGLRQGMRHLRKACRDLRNRAARAPGGRCWRSVAFAGMGVEDGMALVMVAHAGNTRAELARRLGRRFGAVVLSDLGDEMPAVAFSASAEHARRGRGVEPLRVIVAPQRDRLIAVSITYNGAEPMPSFVA